MCSSDLYNVVHSGLVELGLKPHLLSDTLINSMYEIVERHKDRVLPEALLPSVNWRRTANPAQAQALAAVAAA